ncbi:unnamed protein product, partial [Allacma fusca]
MNVIGTWRCCCFLCDRKKFPFLMGNTVRKWPTFEDCVAKYDWSENVTSGGFCPPVWDQFLCWPPTSNGTTVHLQCPLFARGVDTS